MLPLLRLCLISVAIVFASSSVWAEEKFEVTFAFLHFNDVIVLMSVNGESVLRKQMQDKDPSVGLSHRQTYSLPRVALIELRYGAYSYSEEISVDETVKVIYVHPGENPFTIQRNYEELLLD